MRRLGFAALLVVVLAGLGGASGARREPNDYTRAVARPYAEVLAAVQDAAKAQGFRVSNIHDIAASLRKDGIEREPYATVEVCNSRIASLVLNEEPRLGALMPCRIAVYQQADRTIVSMVRPTVLLSLFPQRPELRAAAEDVERSMRAIIDTATK